MNILLTGAFGNVGQFTLQELVGRGHRVRCFDLPSRANKKAARQWATKAEVMWGDLRNPDDVRAAVAGQDAIVHLAFVLPHLSATGVKCEDQPDWAYEINVGGTANLLQAAREASPATRFLFSSSLHVYGKTMHLPPPRTIEETPEPVEHYANHKVICEQMVRHSGLRWAIYRLGAALPVRMILDAGMFEVPLENRIEYVHGRDVALAIANGIEGDDIWGRLWLIGGGPECQLLYREMMEQVLGAAGVGSLPEQAFAQVVFSTDWLDTRESQAVLHFQTRTLAHYTRELRALLGARRVLAQIFQSFVKAWLLTLSPYYPRRWWMVSRRVAPHQA